MQTVGWLVARKVSMPVVDQLKFVQIDSVDRLSGPFSRLFRSMQNPVQAGSKKNRRSFLKQSVVGVGAVGVGVGVGLPPTNLAAQNGPQKPTKGDIAILTFLSALAEVEADLWIQYAELGGATNQGLSPIDLSQNGTTIKTGLAPNYIAALEVLDGDMPVPGELLFNP